MQYESCNNQTSDALDAYARAAELDPNNTHIKARLQLLKSGIASGQPNQHSAPVPQDVHPQAYQNGVGVPPARTTSRPGSKPQPKDYADATIASAENTPTIGAGTPAMAMQESLPTPSLAIADEMIVPPAEHLNNKQ